MYDFIMYMTISLVEANKEINQSILVIEFVTDPLWKDRGSVGLIIHQIYPLYFRSGSVTHPIIDLFHPPPSITCLDPIAVQLY